MQIRFGRLANTITKEAPGVAGSQQGEAARIPRMQAFMPYCS